MATKKTVRPAAKRPKRSTSGEPKRRAGAEAKRRGGAELEEAPPSGMPRVGEILKRMRSQRGFTVREVAEASGLSPSFLSAVERGASDISLGRLTRLAGFFDHDIGSLLGFTARVGQPKFVDKMDRVRIDRGRGVSYELLRLAGMTLELQRIVFDPKSAFRDELVHEGVDIVLVVEGQIALSVDGQDYTMATGDCATFAASFRHKLRNDSGRRATVVAITTGRML